MVSFPLVYADHDLHDYVKKITIESDDVDSDLTDFPLLLNFTDSGLQSNAFSDGLRITFTESTNSTELSHEIEQYDSSNGWLTAWVKIPTLSSSSDTDIFMYYGNNTNLAQQNNTSDTWRSEYKFVGHYHDDFLDSTSNDNDGTNSGSTDATGNIADAQNFDAINDIIGHGSDSSIDNIWDGGGTVSIWLNPNSDGEASIGQIVDKWGASAWLLNGDSESGGTMKATMFYNWSGTNGWWTMTTRDITLNQWNNYVVTFDSDSASNTPVMYVDGVSVAVTATQTPTGTRSTDAANNIHVGNLADTSRTFDGELDEIRFYDGILSADWLDFEYCNQVVTSICEPLTISSEENIGFSPGNYDYYKTISIESDDVDSNLTDFPLLLNFTDTDLQASAFSDGLRIAFTTDSDVFLSHEIEQYDSSNGWLTAWVKVPSIDSSTDTDIRMYYSNNTNVADQQSITDTWNSNYKMAMHLHDNSLLDSTSENNDCTTNQGSTNHVDQHIADSQHFDGINDECFGVLSAGGRALFDDGGTISSWINPNSDGGGSAARWIDAANDGVTGWFSYITADDGSNAKLGFDQRANAVDAIWKTTNLDITLNAWNHVVVVYDDVNGAEDPLFYVNGVNVAMTETQPPSVTLNNPAGNFHIGDNYASDVRMWDGEIDEVRLNTVELSADWIDFEYCNQSATSICEPLTVGSETSTSSALPPFSIESLTSTSITSTTVVLDWTEPQLNGEALLFYQINYTTPQSSTVKSTGTIFTDTGTIDDTITGLTALTQYSTTVSAITLGGKNVTYADVYNFTTSAPPVPITGKFIWFNCSLASNSTQGCIYAMFCPVGEFINGFWENGTASCAVP